MGVKVSYNAHVAQITSRGTSPGCDSSPTLAVFSCSGSARLANMMSAAARVALRRLTRARQSHRVAAAPTMARPPKMPPTIPAIFLALLLSFLRNCACEADSPGTDVSVVVGVGVAARVPGWLGPASVWSGGKLASWLCQR
jgi:hypothetical protein